MIPNDILLYPETGVYPNCHMEVSSSNAEIHRQRLGRAREIPIAEKRQKKLQDPEGSRTPRKQGSRNQLSRDHKGSQRLKQQIWILYGSKLGAICIHNNCAAWVLGFHGSGSVFDIFAYAWSFIFLLVVASSSLNKGACAFTITLSYYNLLCHVQLISLRGLLFFFHKERSGYGRRRI